MGYLHPIPLLNAQVTQRKRRQSVRASGDGARHTGKPYKSAWEHSYEIIENKVAWTMPPLVAEKEWYNQEEDNNTNIMVEGINKI